MQTIGIFFPNGYGIVMGLSGGRKNETNGSGWLAVVGCIACVVPSPPWGEGQGEAFVLLLLLFLCSPQGEEGQGVHFHLNPHLATMPTLQRPDSSSLPK